MRTKILIVDDEEDILQLLKYNLEKNRFEVLIAKNGYEALQKMEFKPDLVILDLMMPIIDGFETLKKIKENEELKSIPVILLTAKATESNEIASLNIGASDFIQKPVSINKLIARIKANLRKNIEDRFTDKENISIDGLKIEVDKFLVTIDNEPIDLSKTEFWILHLLTSNKGKVFSRSKILDKVWGDNVYVTERTVDVHLLKIRKKLKNYAEYIETIKGIGYRFKE
ncbi:response regulator transcription factor [Stygiobacter electus]|uniref:Response regulator transcription factor n=1 Tax=Stygiobacter electus TaxID=3032292 RepID=A0AAE3TDG0_9BACT|nr:response regulator transcription factor [Stygiobacter electus]MDF1612915.1 response regulator transcription factor [Stygiobacter electus]